MINLIMLPFKLISCFLIYLYKWLISPFLKKSCIYYPTCSNYALTAIKEHGVLAGGALTFKRLKMCATDKVGGESYVPISIKGDKKWIL